MLKNIKIGVKLVLVGTIIIIVPLLIVAVLAISRSTKGLTAVENEQLAGRSSDIAQMIDRVFAEEEKAALSYSIDPDVIAAAKAVAEPAAPVEKPAAKPGKAAPPAGPTTADLVSRVDDKLKRISSTKGLGDSYQVIMVVGPDGVAFAASDPAYLGVSFADRGYVKAALAGNVNAGSAALNKVTGKPFAPFAAPIRSGDTVVGAFRAHRRHQLPERPHRRGKDRTTGYAYVVDNTGLIIAHPKAENVFKTNLAELDGTREFTKKMIAGESGVSNYVFQGVAKTAGFAPVKSTGWSVGLTLPDAEYLAAANDVRNLILIISAVALIVGLPHLPACSPAPSPSRWRKGVAFARAGGRRGFHRSSSTSTRRTRSGELAEALNGMSVKLQGHGGHHPGERRAGGLLQRADHRQRAEAGRGRAEPGLHAGGDQRLGGGADRVGGPGGRARAEPGRRGGAGHQPPWRRCSSPSRRCRRTSPRSRGLPASRWRTRWRAPRR